MKGADISILSPIPPNIPNGSGLIDLTNFSPFPKNQNIAKFFFQIGWVEELGSGITNTAKYCSFYSGGKYPEYIEGDIFRTIIPIETSVFIQSTDIKSKLTVKLDTNIIDVVNEGVNDGVNGGVIDGINDGVKKELVKLTKSIIGKPGAKADELHNKIGKSKRTIERYIGILKKIKIIEFKGARKTGGYYITKDFNEKIKG